MLEVENHSRSRALHQIHRTPAIDQTPTGVSFMGSEIPTPDKASELIVDRLETDGQVRQVIQFIGSGGLEELII